MDKDIAKLPPKAKAKDIFYLKPKTVQPKDPCAPWFTAIPLGKNKLTKMMKTMAVEGKLDKPLTNHSLCAYGVAKMFATNIPEKLMIERSGHRSVDGLRQYKRTNMLQELQVYKALQSKQEVDKEKKVPVLAQPASSPHSMPSFSDGTFNNCTFQVSSPFVPVQDNLQAPVQPNFQADMDYLKNIDIQDFLKF